MFGLNLKDAVTSHMELLHKFHKKVKKVIFFILGVVLMGLMVSWKFNGQNLRLVEHHSLEFVWTIIPTLMLFCIAIPSLVILYQEFPDYYTPFMFSIMGHQWYWSIVKAFNLGEESDSFLVESQAFRNLEVDNPIILPLKKGSHLYITSADVIHSFALPALATKVDAIPGRLKECFIFPTNLGKYFGQCSEICGANHAYMPISVEVLPWEK